MTKKLRAIYPFIFAVFPLTSLYFHNLEQISLSEILAPLAAILAFTFFLLEVLRRVLKSRDKAAIVVTLFLFMTFSYGHFFSLLESLWKTKTLSYFDPRYFTIWVGFFLPLVYLVIRTGKRLDSLSQILAIAVFALFMLPLLSIAVYKIKTKTSYLKQSELKTPYETSVAGIQTASELPDIYYIIFDRYPKAETLKEVYDFDNSAFLDYLTDKGFFVAEESTANYLKTAHSLASTLNLQYINYLSNELGEEETSWAPLYKMLQDYEVWRFLKARGYKFIHLGSWWYPTSRNKYADVNYNHYLLPEFSSVLFQTTVFYPVSVFLRLYDVRLEQLERVVFKFEKLEEIPKMHEPTFVFAHMLIPHDPYVVDKEGNFVSWDEVNKRSRKDNFINQLVFTNKKASGLIDKLLQDSETPPIIILQGDEGPFPPQYLLNEKAFNWETASKEELKKKMGILNAYYLPDADTDGLLYKTMTPVNTFRVIFDKYFGADLGTLPDKNFIFLDENHPYKFSEVTDKVR